MERQFDAKPVLIDYVCDSCNSGTMQVSGEPRMPEQLIGFESSPKPMWLHKCKYCKAEKEFDCVYPKLIWMGIGEALK